MKTAKELLETYLAAISGGEVEKAIVLFADDGGIEFPIIPKKHGCASIMVLGGSKSRREYAGVMRKQF